MNAIIKRENEEDSLKKLVAQKECYSMAKKVYFIQFLLAIVGVVIFSFLQIMFNKYKINISLIVATYSITILFVDVFLDSYVGELKEKASLIQELFDCYVLNIPWNNILCGSETESRDIYCNCFEKKKRNFLNLKNWYDESISLVPEEVGKIICQKINCTYDVEIRKKYMLLIKWTTAISVLLIVSIAIFSYTIFANFILAGVLPLLPIIKWIYKNIKSNTSSINAHEKLKININHILKDAANNSSHNAISIRQIQDKIFLNRKEVFLIPDYLYNKWRNKQEDAIRNLVEESIK